MIESPVLAPDSLSLTLMEIDCPACSHTFTIDLIGLAPITQIVCPACAHTYRFPLSFIRRSFKKFERAAKSIRCASTDDGIIARVDHAVKLLGQAKGKPLAVACIVDAGLG